MKLIEINWQPKNRQLRQFGMICLVALPAIAWLWGGSPTVVMALALTGVVLAVVGLAAPACLKPVFLALTILATPIGMLIGELAMLIIYFGIFLPLGLIFRIIRRDALQLRLDRSKESYWEAKKQPVDVASYYRQS